jgi:hypothetical protein
MIRRPLIGDALAFPGLLAVPLGRSRYPVIRLDLRGQPQAVPHVVSDDLGISSREQNRAIFWKHFRSTTSASSASGLAVRSCAQATSSAAAVKNT